MYKILLISLSFWLVACGSNSGGDGGDTPSPIPGVACDSEKFNCSSIDHYVDLFTQRYNIDVNYIVSFDNEDETGGSGSSGTTVGVCRIWSSGAREVLINEDWWVDRLKVSRTLNRTAITYSSNVYNYSFGTIQQRRSGELIVSNIFTTGESVSTSGNDIVIKNKVFQGNQSCPSKYPKKTYNSTSNSTKCEAVVCSAGAGTCNITLGFNLRENQNIGSYTGALLIDDKTINVDYTLEASTSDVLIGEVDRKVLIFHELGHCSLNRPHDSRKGDGSSYPSNMPLSIMYPTINPISLYYSAGYNDYYEDELFDGLVSIFEGSYQSLAMQYSTIGEENGDTSTHNHDHGDCVKFMD